MEIDKILEGSSLDKFLIKVTGDVVRAALDKVSNTIEMDDEESLLEPLNDETFKDTVIETCSVHSNDLIEIKPEEISNVYVRERYDKLVEDTFTEIYDELLRIFDSNNQEMSNNITSLQKKLQLLDCIKDSEQLQKYFQDLSMGIIENAFDKIFKQESKHLKREPYLASDISNNMRHDIEQGSEASIDRLITEHNHEQCTKSNNSLTNENQLEEEVSNSQVDSTIQNGSNIDPQQTKSRETLGSLGFTTAYSTMYETTDEGESYNSGESKYQDSFFSAKNETENGQSTRVDSTMFTTTDDFKENSSLETELPLESTVVTQSTPERMDRSHLDIDTTLTPVPRQSTPLINKISEKQETNLPYSDTSEVLPNNSQIDSNNIHQNTVETDFETTLPSTILVDEHHHHVEYEKTLQDFSGDESSFGDPSSPRTLSRQSSAFGNVTLEFETDWESSMKQVHGEDGMKSKPEEKHKVILHELSFEDNHRLKAPELLCPVFLAVQEDDEFEEKRKKKMSQSIDDLCEMISEDSEDDQGYPSRRRAMSLEGQKRPSKEQRKKAPTREELMAAFEELQHEMMEDKELEQEEGGEEGVNEGQKRITEGEILDSQERHGLDDPLRWHTVVFNGQHKVIDLKLLEPFLKVLTHGGYHHEGDMKTVIVVLTACNLPNKKMKRYPFLMEQLFFFIISTMDLLVTSEEYIFVYFHGGTSKNQSPSFSWLKKYYQYIDHRLRKSVTKVFVVHPNLWLKSVFRLCRPFLSSNFARKLKFVNTLKDLSSHIKTDFIFIPDEVIKADPDYRKLQSK